jgi:hypothetical protein
VSASARLTSAAGADGAEAAIATAEGDTGSMSQSRRAGDGTNRGAPSRPRLAHIRPRCPCPLRPSPSCRRAGTSPLPHKKARRDRRTSMDRSMRGQLPDRDAGLDPAHVGLAENELIEGDVTRSTERDLGRCHIGVLRDGRPKASLSTCNPSRTPRPALPLPWPFPQRNRECRVPVS